MSDRHKQAGFKAFRSALGPMLRSGAAAIGRSARTPLGKQVATRGAYAAGGALYGNAMLKDDATPAAKVQVPLTSAAIFAAMGPSMARSVQRGELLKTVAKTGIGLGVPAYHATIGDVSKQKLGRIVEDAQRPGKAIGQGIALATSNNPYADLTAVLGDAASNALARPSAQKAIASLSAGAKDAAKVYAQDTATALKPTVLEGMKGMGTDLGMHIGTAGSVGLAAWLATRLAQAQPVPPRDTSVAEADRYYKEKQRKKLMALLVGTLAGGAASGAYVWRGTHKTASAYATTPRYTNAPYEGNAGWYRHWLIKGAEVVAYLDTHPAAGMDAIKVSNLYVPPEHRGKDYGRSLIKMAMAQRPDKDVVLTPAPWKDASVPKAGLERLYSSLGFQKMAGERHKDLMLFHRSTAFQMGVKAAAMKPLAAGQSLARVGGGLGGSGGAKVGGMPSVAPPRQQAAGGMKPLAAGSTAAKVGGPLGGSGGAAVARMPVVSAPKTSSGGMKPFGSGASLAKVGGPLGGSGGASVNRMTSGAAAARAPLR